MEGENEVKKLLTRDLTIKTISLLFAVLLWFYVLGEDNPLDTGTFSVRLRVIGQEKLSERRLVIKGDYDKTVKITVRGRKSIIKNINAEDFDAVLDFSNIRDGGVKLLSVSSYSYKGNEEGIDITGIAPGTIRVEFEKLGENTFPVELETTGRLKDGYKIVSKTITPETIEVTDVSSVIKSIASVKAYVNVDNLGKSVATTKECRVFGKDGKEIQGFAKKYSVEIKLEVAKEVDITPVVVGTPAKNYIDTERVVKPGKALISGDSEVLDKINGLETEPIDIENALKTIEAFSTIKLPEGVALVETPQRVEVDVQIEELAKKDISITKNDISIINTEIDNSLKYTIVTGSIAVSLKGYGAELQEISIASLLPKVDVSNLGEGDYQLPLELVLPERVKAVSEYLVEVKIEKR